MYITKGFTQIKIWIINSQLYIAFGNTMRALHIAKYGRFPVLTDCILPEKDKDSILVKIHYAPINPSDLNFYQGKYGIKKAGFPIVGFEGAGVIYEAQNQQLIGRKVSFIADSTNGTHATHIKTTLKNCMVWSDDVQTREVSTSWINPLSCIGLCQIIEKENPQNVLLSAATSQLNKMMIRVIANKWPHLNTVGLSRNSANQAILKQLGLKKFIAHGQKLNSQIKQLQGKTLYLDCVGGEFCGQIFNTLPQNSIMVSYGRLSGEPLGKVDLGSLYYQNKVIKGFWLNNWFSQQNGSQLERKKSDVIRHFDTFYSSKIRQTFKLENFMDAYRASIKDQSLGKILLDLQ